MNYYIFVLVTILTKTSLFFIKKARTQEHFVT